MTVDKACLEVSFIITTVGCNYGLALTEMLLFMHMEDTVSL